MNSVSWFIYIADVTDNIGFVLTLFGIFALLATCVCWFGYAMSEDKGTGEMLKRTGGRLPIISAVVLTTACFIPSKTTMYGIAASQIGETVASSQDAKEMIDDTKQILREYLKSLKKDSK